LPLLSAWLSQVYNPLLIFLNFSKNEFLQSKNEVEDEGKPEGANFIA